MSFIIKMWIKSEMMFKQLTICALFLPIFFSPLGDSITATPSSPPVVHAVLFYSPSCGHCYIVVTEVLPPLFDKYGDQLNIAGVDISTAGGQALFIAAIDYFNYGSGPVPFLVVGDQYLIGSIDIPEKFPGLIEQYLPQGGVDWPPIPGFAEALSASQPTETPVTPATQVSPTLPTTVLVTPATPTSHIPIPTASVSPTPTPATGLIMTAGHSNGLGTNFTRDLVGNSLAVIILVAMSFSMIAAVYSFRRTPGVDRVEASGDPSLGLLMPVLCLIGLGVAGYLAYVETVQVEAYCGPVGDCNTVQQSAYARLFGVLPIGILGMVGYLAILAAWVIGRFSRSRLAAYANLIMLGLTIFGLLFSIYLTFLEPFVIGATCAWCLTSAIIMTLLFWLSLMPARKALIKIFSKG